MFTMQSMVVNYMTIQFDVDLGFVLIAVQESAFLPPPTQFDIL